MSNTRRPRNRPRTSEPRSDRTLDANLRPGQDLTHLLTDDDRAAMESETDAAARGDAEAAWHHYMQGLIVEESLHPHRLREIADLGDDAPGWVYSRWCVDQAYRWMMLNEDPRTDDMVRLVLAVAHLDHVEPLLEQPEALKEYGTLVSVCDWLAEQLCVYDAGGLRDFLDVRAEPALIERADLVEQWCDAPLGVYRLQEMRGPVLVVRDLVHETDTEVLNVGSFVEQPTDVVLGRVVPISRPPYRMFDSRPVAVDEQTAAEAAAALRAGTAAWLDAITTAREEGRLERGFSCHGQTMFSSDIVPERPGWQPDGDPPGRMVELLEAGLDPYVANGVMVAEVALIAATVSDDSAAVVGPQLSAVLTDSRVFAAALTHCTAPEREAAWRRLAEVSTSPVRERCLKLAERCRRAA